MQQRKPWNQAFASTAMKEYEGIVENRVRQLLGCLENLVLGSARKEGAPLDMAAWLQYFK
jgi:cytochrome P450